MMASNVYVIAREMGEDYLLLSMDGAVLGFGSQFEAEDYADELDEEGEFVAIPYDPAMGDMIWIVS
jgi:hypothetical protein